MIQQIHQVSDDQRQQYINFAQLLEYTPSDVPGILYRNKGWIHSRDLAAMVGRKDDRFLRGEDSPIRTCAISGNEGIKHILHATDEEFAEFYARIRSHALKELRHIRKLRQARTSQKQEVLGL